MNARNLISKVPQTGGVTQGAISLAVQIILFVAVFCLVGQPALAKGVKNCSDTSKSAYKACKSGVEDDYNIAVGNCYNLADKEAIKDCKNDAKDQRKDDKESCKDQKDARFDLCDQLGEDPYNPDIGSLIFEDPAAIGDTVAANPYFPLVPGYMWTYKTRDATDTVIETNTVEVLDPAVEGVTIEGIACAVVHDIVYKGDVDTTDPAALDAAIKLEDTHDYYAQQTDGTVWYFGEFSLAQQECDEETGELCQGLWGDEGSWQAGFEGGKPGIIMFADPSAVAYGTVYRQELYLGDAEDAAEVMSFDEAEVTVPYPPGTFNSNVLETKDFSPLEPGTGDYKYYAPGIGVIVEKAYEDDEITGEENQLVSFTTP